MSASEGVTLREKVRQFNARLEATRTLQTSVGGQLEDARREADDRHKVQNVLRLMSEKLSGESETLTEKIVSLGLKDAFFHEDLSLEVNHYVAYGKPAIKLLLCDHKRRVKGDPLKAFGGGPASLIGILLRVLSIIRQPHLARVLLLDEPLLQVSDLYKERTAAIVRKICEPAESGGLGFAVLVISHDKVYKQQTRHAYRAQLAADGQSLSLVRPAQVNEESLDELAD